MLVPTAVRPVPSAGLLTQHSLDGWPALSVPLMLASRVPCLFGFLDQLALVLPQELPEVLTDTSPGVDKSQAASEPQGLLTAPPKDLCRAFSLAQLEPVLTAVSLDLFTGLRLARPLHLSTQALPSTFLDGSHPHLATSPLT